MADTVEINFLTLLISIILGSIHLFSTSLHHWIFRSPQIATSFSGGLAIAYVFIHLLPELETSDLTLGQTPTHFITLLGFLLFYGLQRLAWKSSRELNIQHSSLLFGIRLGFASLYNFLLIYTIPQQFKENILWSMVYLIALGLHLLSNDHGLSEQHTVLFHQWGRYALVGAIATGLFVDLTHSATHEPIISDFLTALLSGFVLFNIFAEELPKHQETKYRWFILGVMVYLGLIFGTLA